MRKILFVIAIVLASVAVKAQFTLTPAGFVSSTDEAKNYAVLKFENKSKEKLYVGTQLFVSKKAVSPEDVISRIENEAITVNGVADVVVGKALGNNVAIKINFTIIFQFRDNNIKVSAPVINAVHRSDLPVIDGLEYYNMLWSSSGKLKKPAIKDGLESFFNNFVIDLQKSINTEDQDW